MPGGVAPADGRDARTHERETTMPIAPHVVALGLGLALCVAPIAAQDAPGEETPTPAGSAEAPAVTSEAATNGDASLTGTSQRVGSALQRHPLGSPSSLTLQEVAALPPPTVLEAEASAEDAPIIRSMIRDEAAHRDRVARIRRLRELAIAQGDAERLVALDRLERLEGQRHETRALMARTRLSEPGFRVTEPFLRHGGVLRMRHALAGAGTRGAGEAQRTPGRVQTRMLQPSRSPRGGSGGGRPPAGNGAGRGEGSRGGGPR